MFVEKAKRSAVWPAVTSLVLSAGLIWRCGAEGQGAPGSAPVQKAAQAPTPPKQEPEKDPKVKDPNAKPEAPAEDPKDADDRLDNARSLVDKAKQTTADTDRAVKEIKPLTEAKPVDEDAVSRVRQLADAVASLTLKGLRAKAIELLSDAGKEPSKGPKDAKSLKQMVLDLEALKGKLKKDSPRLATCDSLIKELNDQRDALKKR